MNEHARIRILSVDDHPLLREGIDIVVGGQADMELVAHAENGQMALRNSGNTGPM